MHREPRSAPPAPRACVGRCRPSPGASLSAWFLVLLAVALGCSVLAGCRRDKIRHLPPVLEEGIVPGSGPATAPRRLEPARIGAKASAPG
jgi:hypothetical protein